MKRKRELENNNINERKQQTPTNRKTQKLTHIIITNNTETKIKLLNNRKTNTINTTIKIKIEKTEENV